MANSQQIAGRPENRKTEIRTPQYARRQDRTLQNGTEWQEDKIGRKYHTAVCPEGPADDGKRLDSLSPRWTLNCDRYFRFIWMGRGSGGGVGAALAPIRGVADFCLGV